MAPRWNLLGGYQHFGVIHFRSREGGFHMILRNLVTTYQAAHNAGNQNLILHCHENLKTFYNSVYCTSRPQCWNVET
jgi:hypothetical protein